MSNPSGPLSSLRSDNVVGDKGKSNAYTSQALEGKDVKDMLLNVGSGGGAAAAAPAAGGAGGASGGAAADAPAEEEKKEEGTKDRSRYSGQH